MSIHPGGKARPLDNLACNGHGNFAKLRYAIALLARLTPPITCRQILSTS